MADSEIVYHKGGGVTLAGYDAVEIARAASLHGMIGLLDRGVGMRGLTMKRALEMAGKYTGRAYKRSEAEQARTDIHVWIETMKSAIPTRNNR